MHGNLMGGHADRIRRHLAGVRGEMIGPGDGRYDEARTLFYSGFDRRPAAVIRAADASDVSRVVALARESGVPLAVRSGGHSPAGHSSVEGGLVLDLSGLKGMTIDADARTAWVGTGLTAGDYTSAVGAHGLATGFGDSPSVGVGGITLAGGVGYLHRKYGLTLDSLLAADVVTADGEIVRADEATHPDLFWAIRGGGGNFGVATRFHFRLHPVREVVAGMLILPATAERVVSFLALADAAPEELSGIANVMAAPPMPFIPPDHHGRPVIVAMLAWTGPAEDGQKVLQPFRALAPPLADLLRPMRYADIYAGAEPPRPPMLALHTTFIDGLDAPGAEAILDALQPATAMMRVAQFRVLGGAVARVSNEATAFAHRQRRIMATIAAAYADPEQASEKRAWAARVAEGLNRGEPGAYIGFLGDEGEERVREAYPGSTWERLARIKRQYDPGNVFRLNQNVPPEGGPRRRGEA